jgi:hypothetical protein
MRFPWLPAAPAFALTLAGAPSVAEEPLRQVLIDLDRNVRVSHWSLSSDQAAPGSPVAWRIEKDVLHGGRQEGVDRIRVINGDLSFTIIPTRGMNLWEGRCGDVRLGWDSPVKEVVHPGHVNLSERNGLGWLEGFAEWMNRCGLASNGAAGLDEVRSNTGSVIAVNLTLHGKVSYLPARSAEVVVEGGARPVIKVRGTVDETMMFGTQLRLVTEISTEVGSRTITVRDEIQNLAATEQEFQVLYHANFGTPLLGGGAEVVAPALRVTPRDPRAAEGDIREWNRFCPPQRGYVEQVYFLKLAAGADGKTEVLLRNPRGDRGVSLTYSVNELPCFTLWKNTAAEENGYVTGLEPATNFPNNRSFERKHGRVPRLAGGGKYQATFAFTVHLDAPAVEAAKGRVEKLAAGKAPALDAKPMPDVSP